MKKLEQECAKWSGRCPGVYITLNPVNPALLGRANNKAITYAKNTTKDSEVISLEWLYVDIDPVRPTGVNASEDEKKLAYEKAKEVYRYLKQQGFPAGVIADSGNGYHLKYKIHLPNDKASRQIVQNTLHLLDLKFSDDLVKVDTTTSNPARICKVYGTLSCKGDHTPERPQRLNKIIHVPDKIECTPDEVLKSLANLLPKNEHMNNSNYSFNSKNKTTFWIDDVEKWLEEKGIHVKSIGEWQGGKKYLLEQCVWDPSHTDNSAIVVQFPRGEIVAMCQHNSCQGKGWTDFRNTVEPEWRKETKQIKQIDDEADDDEILEMIKYPNPIQEHAFHGLAGEVVNAIAPHTEGDKAALLINFLTLFGNVIGDGPHIAVEATRHPGRIFAVLVGDFSVGRKGTSWNHVRRLFEMNNRDYMKSNVKSGLSTGEGLIYHVRDPIYRTEVEKKDDGSIIYKDVLEDQGVEDKRLLVIESEFASVLKVAKRQGNTVTEIIRKAWDDGTCQTLTKNSAIKMTDAHISIIGHVTKHELIKHLNDTDMANGFANRFLWFCVKRSKQLPFGGNIDTVNFQGILEQLNRAIKFSQMMERIALDDKAKEIWTQVYGALTTPQRGGNVLFKDITSRIAPQVLRLSLLYALLDCSEKIRPPHLLAALDVIKYSVDSCKYIFSNTLTPTLGDLIFQYIKKSGTEGITKTEIHKVLKNNKSKIEIDTQLSLLMEQQVIYFKKNGKKQTFYAYEN